MNIKLNKSEKYHRNSALVSKLILVFISIVQMPILCLAFASTLIQTQIADPSVFKVKMANSSEVYYVMGATGPDTRVLPLYRSKDGLNFSFWKNYDPSALDPVYSYCHLWAPEINQKLDGTYLLFFSALRYRKGESCGTPDATTLFKSFANSDQLIFSSPELFVAKSPLSGPQSYTQQGCAGGVIDRAHCENTMRIDSDFFIDPLTQKQWIFYVWFGFDQSWNSISSFEISDANVKYTNRRPLLANEENINEAPDVFYRAPYYYMIFSHGDFRNSYALSYIYGKSLWELRQLPITKTNPKTYSLMPVEYLPSVPTKCLGYSGLPIKSAGGHSSTLEIDGRYYLFYHQSVFTYDGLGCQIFNSRDVYRTELNFLPNGKIQELKF